MLRKQLYVVFTRPTAGMELVMAVIIRAGSLAEAKAIAASDPMNTKSARSHTARPRLFNEGTVMVNLTYSDGKREVI